MLTPLTSNNASVPAANERPNSRDDDVAVCVLSCVIVTPSPAVLMADSSALTSQFVPQLSVPV